MFVGAFFRTRNILTHTSFLEQGIFTCLFICVGDNIKLYIGESTLDVGEQTVGETTGYQTEVSRYSRPICKLESSFLSSTKTSQNMYIWITVSHPAVTWALRHVKLPSKNKRSK